MTASAQTLTTAVEVAAQRWSDRVAYVIGDQTLTFTELADRSAQVGGLLARQGVAAGDRVAIWSRSSVDYVVTMMAIARVGASAVPLNTRLKSEDANPITDLAGPSLLLLGPEARSGCPISMQGRPFPSLYLDEVGREAAAVPADRAAVDGSQGPDDVVQMQFTSGSTGTPKLVQLSQGTILRSAHTLAELMELGPEDRFFSPMPFYHAGGSVLVLLAPLVSGCSVHVQPLFNAAQALSQMNDDQSTVTIGHQPHYAEYLTSGLRTPGSLRLAFIFANPAFNRRVQDYLGSASLVSPYGLTETALGGTSPHWRDSAQVRLGTVGTPTDGTEVRVDPPAGAAAGPPVQGEVLIRGWCVSPGYVGSGAPPMTDSDGWYHTGDLGSFDEAGNLRLEGRLKDIIRVGGENVSPVELENCLLHHPAVKQAVVLARPDDRLGEVCVAAVELAAGVDARAEELIEHCAAALASFKVPRQLVIVDQWPTTSSGKIAKVELRRLFDLER
ncbi:MAG: fatty-acyl-CoA synthase [Actinomycetota bacterium]|nr:fatty-acyl-CoA synthase [Actinomycetota bacterium]